MTEDGDVEPAPPFVGEDRDRARLIGFTVHLVNGWLFALLYGVTMPEQGVSQLVSVDLGNGRYGAQGDAVAVVAPWTPPHVGDEIEPERLVRLIDAAFAARRKRMT